MEYHSVDIEASKYGLSRQSFSRQIEYISRNYRVARLKDAAQALSSKKDEGRQIIITFDDAFENFYDSAFPILETYQIPCTVFVPTGFLGKWNEWDSAKDGIPRLKLMNKGHLESLQKTGLIDFGSHTVDHVSMRNLTESEMRHQAVQSRKTLEQILNTPIDLFAYPYGQLRDFSKMAMRILAEAGYRMAVTTRWGSLNSHYDKLRLRRIFFGEKDDGSEIRVKIEGSYDWFEVKEIFGFLVDCLLNTRKILRQRT